MLPPDCLEVNSIVDINIKKKVHNLVFQGRASLRKTRIICTESILKIKTSGLERCINWQIVTDVLKERGVKMRHARGSFEMSVLFTTPPGQSYQKTT